MHIPAPNPKAPNPPKATKAAKDPKVPTTSKTHHAPVTPGSTQSSSPDAEVPRLAVGNYAVATIRTRPWLATPITTAGSGSGKARRSKNQPAILNPIFEQCTQHITDPFWISIFNQAAIGKFPRGFLFKDNSLTYKRGTKISRIDLSTDPVTAATELMTFFGRMAGIMSTADQARSRQELEDRLTEGVSLHTCTWADIKKKKVREMLIGSFVEDLVKQYELVDRERIQLRSMINLGFILGHFSSTNVQFSQGRIHGIAGLDFDATTRKFSINSSCQPRHSKSSKSRQSRSVKIVDAETESVSSSGLVSFMVLWIKFLESLEKRAHGKAGPLDLPPTPMTPHSLTSADITTDITTDVVTDVLTDVIESS
jgi:hypothetical protein